jgi:toxin ParE1/3/4
LTQVRWTRAAAADLSRIAAYIRRDNPTAARNVAQTIFDAGNSLRQFPERGRLGRIADTRELVFPGWPYILIYDESGGDVRILRVYHAAQDWP